MASKANGTNKNNATPTFHQKQVDASRSGIPVNINDIRAEQDAQTQRQRAMMDEQRAREVAEKDAIDAAYNANRVNGTSGAKPGRK